MVASKGISLSLGVARRSKCPNGRSCSNSTLSLSQVLAEGGARRAPLATSVSNALETKA